MSTLFPFGLSLEMIVSFETEVARVRGETARLDAAFLRAAYLGQRERFDYEARLGEIQVLPDNEAHVANLKRHWAKSNQAYEEGLRARLELQQKRLFRRAILRLDKCRLDYARGSTKGREHLRRLQEEWEAAQKEEVRQAVEDQTYLGKRDALRHLIDELKGDRVFLALVDASDPLGSGNQFAMERALDCLQRGVQLGGGENAHAAIEVLDAGLNRLDVAKLAYESSLRKLRKGKKSGKKLYQAIVADLARVPLRADHEDPPARRLLDDQIENFELELTQLARNALSHPRRAVALFADVHAAVAAELDARIAEAREQWNLAAEAVAQARQMILDWRNPACEPRCHASVAGPFVARLARVEAGLNDDDHRRALQDAQAFAEAVAEEDARLRDVYSDWLQLTQVDMATRAQTYMVEATRQEELEQEEAFSFELNGGSTPGELMGRIPEILSTVFESMTPEAAGTAWREIGTELARNQSIWLTRATARHAFVAAGCWRPGDGVDLDDLARVVAADEGSAVLASFYEQVSVLESLLTAARRRVDSITARDLRIVPEERLARATGEIEEVKRTGFLPTDRYETLRAALSGLDIQLANLPAMDESQAQTRGRILVLHAELDALLATGKARIARARHERNLLEVSVNDDYWLAACADFAAAVAEWKQSVAKPYEVRKRAFGALPPADYPDEEQQLIRLRDKASALLARGQHDNVTGRLASFLDRAMRARTEALARIEGDGTAENPGERAGLLERYERCKKRARKSKKSWDAQIHWYNRYVLKNDQEKRDVQTRLLSIESRWLPEAAGLLLSNRPDVFDQSKKLLGWIERELDRVGWTLAGIPLVSGTRDSVLNRIHRRRVRLSHRDWKTYRRADRDVLRARLDEIEAEAEQQHNDKTHADIANWDRQFNDIAERIPQDKADRARCRLELDESNPESCASALANLQVALSAVTEVYQDVFAGLEKELRAVKRCIGSKHQQWSEGTRRMAELSSKIRMLSEKLDRPDALVAELAEIRRKERETEANKRAWREAQKQFREQPWVSGPRPKLSSKPHARSSRKHRLVYECYRRAVHAADAEEYRRAVATLREAWDFEYMDEGSGVDTTLLSEASKRWAAAVKQFAAQIDEVLAWTQDPAWSAVGAFAEPGRLPEALRRRIVPLGGLLQPGVFATLAAQAEMASDPETLRSLREAALAKVNQAKESLYTTRQLPLLRHSPFKTATVLREDPVVELPAMPNLSSLRTLDQVIVDIERLLIIALPT